MPHSPETPKPSSGKRLLIAYLVKVRAEAAANGGRLLDKDLAEKVFGVSAAAFSSWQSESNNSARPEGANRTVMAAWSDGAIPAAAWETREERQRIERAHDRGAGLLEGPGPAAAPTPPTAA